MIAIRKFGWLALVLAAFVGCAKEEPATETPAETTPAETTPAETTPAPASPAPETPPAATPGEVKPEAGGASAELPEGEAPAIEAPTPTPATKGEEAPKAEEKEAAVLLAPEEVAEIKTLPAGEAEQALKQLVCPVSEEHLGSMGKPVKVTAEGRTFFLCCKGCSKDVADDPAAVVAKLKN